jgi:hypothetical protein
MNANAKKPVADRPAPSADNSGRIIAIHIPVNRNDGTPVGDHWVKTAKALLSRLFGGYTHQRVTGGWVFTGVDPEGVYKVGDLVEEQMDRVFAYVEPSKNTVAKRAAVRNFAIVLAGELKQDSVYLEVRPAHAVFCQATDKLTKVSAK